MYTGETKYGSGALENPQASGSNQTAFGVAALRDNTSQWNTAVGAYAALVNTSGVANTCVGVNSLLENTSGGYNTSLGAAALCYNLNGDNNTAVGSNSMGDQSNIMGSNNTALGYQSGYMNSGDYNTFLGATTDSNSTAVQYSTAVGYGAMVDASNQIMMGTASEQVVIPGSAVLTNTDPASYNQATSIVPKSYVDSIASGIIPVPSCQCATTGDVDLVTGGLLIIDGYQTVADDRVLVKCQGNLLDDNASTSDIDNGIYVVVAAGPWTRADDCSTGTDVTSTLTFIENGALNGFKAFAEYNSPAVVDTDPIEYILFYSTSFTLGNGLGLSGNTLNVDTQLSGPANPFLTFVGINGGTSTAYSLDTGSTSASDVLVNGVRVGKGAGNIGTNTVVGASAFQSNSSGAYSTVVGQNALKFNTSGTQNNAFGASALQNNTTGSNNTAMGNSALQNNTTGSSNTGIGWNALAFNTTGILNTAVGRSALGSATNCSNNTALGSYAMQSNTTGSNNVAIGTYSLNANSSGIRNVAIGDSALQLNTTGYSNTVIGWNAGAGISTGYGNTVIGSNATTVTGVTNNQIVLGTSAETMYIPGGFNQKVGPLLTLASPTANVLSLPLAQYYLVETPGSDASDNVIMTLPVPSAAFKGAQITFHFVLGSGGWTFNTSPTGAYFYTIRATTDNSPSNQMTSDGNGYATVTIMCDGSYWYWLYYL